MMTQFSGDVFGLLAKFFFGGSGPSHATLTSTFQQIGFGPDHDPYQNGDATFNKQKRVAKAFNYAEKRGVSRKLVELLLTDLRLHRVFSATSTDTVQLCDQLRAALRRDGWELDSQGHMTNVGSIQLDAGGRQALEDQLTRLQRNTEDPALQIGTAKELLEAVAKFVLEAAGMGEAVPKTEFRPLVALAIERLDLHPKTVDQDLPGGKAVRQVRQAARQIATAVNELRNAQGTGHGRTLPTGVSPEMARYVAREAASLAQWLLSELKSQYGE